MAIRPATSADEQLLRSAFLAGRPELAVLPHQLIEMQEQAQRTQYDMAFPGNIDHVIEYGPDRRPVGRCWTWRSEVEHRLLDLVVLDTYRGQGIARSVLTELAADAEEHRVPLRLSVWSTNAGAIGLYCSAGFEQYDEQNGYFTMQLGPSA